MRDVQCRCGGGGLHSCYKHEPHCPVVCGDWCEDCGYQQCVCGPPVLLDVYGEVIA